MALRPSERFRIFQRDDFTCQYCGARAPDVRLHVDHVQPRINDGSDDHSNLITACQDCNLAKSTELSVQIQVQAIFRAVTRRFGPFGGEESQFILREIEYAVVVGDRQLEFIFNTIDDYEHVRPYLDTITDREDRCLPDDPNIGYGFGDYDYPDPLGDGEPFVSPLIQ